MALARTIELQSRKCRLKRRRGLESGDSVAATPITSWAQLIESEGKPPKTKGRTLPIAKVIDLFVEFHLGEHRTDAWAEDFRARFGTADNLRWALNVYAGPDSPACRWLLQHGNVGLRGMIGEFYKWLQASCVAGVF